MCSSTPPLLLEEALLERAQQLVLVAKARIEPAHRGARAAHDLGDRNVSGAALLDQPLGRVEQPVQRPLRPRLLGVGHRLEAAVLGLRGTHLARLLQGPAVGNPASCLEIDHEMESESNSLRGL